MSRITKEPEVRKQEILETAIAVFAERGYEKTKMSDIAEKMGVAQGLCYRYFPSKEALFDSAVEEYAHILAAPMIAVVCDASLSLRQKVERFPGYMEVETQDNTYYPVFHQEGSKKIHDQLSIQVGEIMMPYVADAIKLAHENGETQICDDKTAASFCVFGQMGILLDHQMDGKERGDRIRAFLLDVFFHAQVQNHSEELRI
ncbi:MAG: TetR/AcrR family transcriptional regulator [Oscillospiraceae bacterium]|nr:TetR/AcrR family transcriptional regulator [Oscillospiraceae bacterium]